MEKIASYLLAGLPSGTKSISSSVDAGNQPIFRLPSKNCFPSKPILFISGDVNPLDTSKNPDLLNLGIHITHGKYISVSDLWRTSTGLELNECMWLYWNEGEMEFFNDVNVKVSLCDYFFKLRKNFSLFLLKTVFQPTLFRIIRTM
jgi:hypothetical protein